MKIIRITVLVLFVLVLAFFGYAKFTEYRHIDSTLPTISGPKEPLKISCNYSDKDLLQGLTAYDEKDGDLTSEIMISNFSRLLEKGKCKVNYVVFDSSNQPATFSREVIFTDYRSPRIYLSKPLVFQKGSNENIYGYIGANDIIDGDISSLVRAVETNVNSLQAGKYSVKIEVTNSLGDTTEMILPVHILELVDSKVEISLTQNVVYIKKGSAFDPLKYIKGVANIDGTVLDKNLIKVTAAADTNKPGVYEVIYTAEQNPTSKGLSSLTVVVE